MKDLPHPPKALADKVSGKTQVEGAREFHERHSITSRGIQMLMARTAQSTRATPTFSLSRLVRCLA